MKKRCQLLLYNKTKVLSHCLTQWWMSLFMHIAGSSRSQAGLSGGLCSLLAGFPASYRKPFMMQGPSWWYGPFPVSRNMLLGFVIGFHQRKKQKRDLKQLTYNNTAVYAGTLYLINQGWFSNWEQVVHPTTTAIGQLWGHKQRHKHTQYKQLLGLRQLAELSEK